MTKPLSDEKIEELWHSSGAPHTGVIGFARAIEAAVQRPIADLMCQWKSGKISGDELADKLFSLFASTPSSAVLEAQSTDQRLLNLLCRIHRDGGHYIAEHGLDKAVEDADLRVAEQNAALDAQAKQEPVAWAYTINNSHSVFSTEKPPEDAYDEGTLYPLYAAPVVQEKQEPVAWLARGIHGGKVIAAKLHDYKRDADNTASVFIEHYGAAETVPLYAAPVVQPGMVMEGFKAACAFIDSHVADPDITSEMRKTYAEFMRMRAMIAAAEGKG